MPHGQNQYQHLYGKQRWRNRARRQIRRHPLCALCLARGIITAAQCADHIFPHRGDLEKFWNGELRSLCFACHDRSAKHEQAEGFLRGVGADGMPIDPRHPAYRISHGPLWTRSLASAKVESRYVQPKSRKAGQCLTVR